MSDTPAPTERKPSSSLWFHALLFLATVITTTATGALYVHPERMLPIADGWTFSLPLLVILLCHEFGHFTVARLHGVKASLPYFLPLPPPIGMLGTLGAVIRMPPATDRRKLIDIGAAGPIAGLVVAIPILLYGLSLSKVAPLVGVGMQEGNSLLYALLKFLVTGRWLPADGADIMLHPTALAGWAGLLLTMINLLPFGQLDGGHVAVAYLGNRYTSFSRRLSPALLLLSVGVFAWVWFLTDGLLADPAVARVLASQGVDSVSVALAAAMPWLVWFGMLRLMSYLAGGEHPAVDDKPLGRSRGVLFWFVVVVFVAIFMPVPLRFSIGKVDVSSATTPAKAATTSTDAGVDAQDDRRD
jgi:membrane-associated protease RseP (regulator of RpoE activity)